MFNQNNCSQMIKYSAYSMSQRHLKKNARFFNFEMIKPLEIFSIIFNCIFYPSFKIRDSGINTSTLKKNINSFLWNSMRCKNYLGIRFQNLKYT